MGLHIYAPNIVIDKQIIDIENKTIRTYVQLKIETNDEGLWVDLTTEDLMQPHDLAVLLNKTIKILYALSDDHNITMEQFIQES